MIVYNLTCGRQHTFEGWFANAEAFDRQNQNGLITCPVCGDHQIVRLPAGPHLRKILPSPQPLQPTEADLEKLLEGLRQTLESIEDVGEAFVEEARRIHQAESPQRSIRGVASLGEAVELLQEGVSVLPMPLLNKKGLH